MVDAEPLRLDLIDDRGVSGASTNLLDPRRWATRGLLSGAAAADLPLAAVCAIMVMKGDGGMPLLMLVVLALPPGATAADPALLGLFVYVAKELPLPMGAGQVAAVPLATAVRLLCCCCCCCCLFGFCKIPDLLAATDLLLLDPLVPSILFLRLRALNCPALSW